MSNRSSRGARSAQAVRTPSVLKALSKRKREREKRPTVSAQQAKFYARLLADLRACDHAPRLAQELAPYDPHGKIAETIIRTDPVRSLVRRLEACGPRKACKHPQCPRCRREHIGRRVDAALPLFCAHPKDSVFWVTVLISPERELFEPREVGNYLDPADYRLPTGQDAAAKSRRLIREAGAKVDGAIRTLKPTLFVAEGAFEFGIIDPATCGLQKARFLQDMGVAAGAGATAGDLALLHMHFVAVVRCGDRYATQADISGALAAKFPRRHQVLVTPMRSHPSFPISVSKVVAYASKAFSSFRAERAVEIARVLDALGHKGTAYVRRWNDHKSASG